MPTVTFTRALARHVGALEPLEVDADTLATALDAAFEAHPVLRSYVLDDQGNVRQHVQVFIDGRPLPARDQLDGPVGAGAAIHVLQALSGG